MEQDIQVNMDVYAPPQFRYVATVGDYDLDCTYGQGKTRLDAIVDLLDQLEE